MTLWSHSPTPPASVAYPQTFLYPYSFLPLFWWPASPSFTIFSDIPSKSLNSMVVQTYANLLPPALLSSSVPHPFMLSLPVLSSLEVTSHPTVIALYQHLFSSLLLHPWTLMVKEKYRHWKAVILSICFLILHEILYGEHENGVLDSCPLGEPLVLSSALIHFFSDPLSFNFFSLNSLWNWR